MSQTAWLFSSGVWTKIEDPYYIALHRADGVSGAEATKAAGFEQFEKFGGRVALYEWCLPEPPDPSEYLVRFSLGVMWYNIYVNDLPDLIQLLSLLAGIERVWPGDGTIWQMLDNEEGSDRR